jgi:uncharacterized protein YlzI (FlbEa/FlbD family)
VAYYRAKTDTDVTVLEGDSYRVRESEQEVV